MEDKMDNDERTQPESAEPELGPQQEELTDLELVEQEADAVTGGAYEPYLSPPATKQGKFKGVPPPVRP
jgi:hypothetical protein